jgi:hypothetical protein
MKVHQKPLTLPQRQYLYNSIDTMLEAGVIEACKPEDVKCMSATTLTQKTHQGKGHSLTELQHRVNDECVTNGMEPRFDLPPRTTPTPDDNTPEETKWRICQNFTQINKITKVAPMPQGDIRAKQHASAGTDGYPDSTSPQGSMLYWWTRNQDHTLPSTWKAGGTSGIGVCHLD